MRMFFGIIVGIILTIGAAYLYDSIRSTGGAEGIDARPLVNWDVVNHKVKALSSTVQNGWARLTGHAKDS
jgi:hypothetical protein